MFLQVHLLLQLVQTDLIQIIVVLVCGQVCILAILVCCLVI